MVIDNNHNHNNRGQHTSRSGNARGDYHAGRDGGSTRRGAHDGSGHDGHHGRHHDGRHVDHKHHTSRHHHYGYHPYWWTGFLWYGLDHLYGRPYYGGYYDNSYGYGSNRYVDSYATLETPLDAAVGPDEFSSQSAGDNSEYFLLAAEAAFRAGRYDQAMRELQHALVERPGDGRAILFMSQVLFATGNYQQAIAAAYQGMSLLDEEHWGFLIENYDKYYGNNDYVSQMKRLDDYIVKNPEAAYAYALRGYHWGFLGYAKAARKALQKAIELEPRDQMAAKLFVKFGGSAPVAKPEAKSESPPGQDKAKQDKASALPTPPKKNESPLILEGSE